MRYGTINYSDWIAMGKALFGDDIEQWKFCCPICGNVATVADYRKYKNAGATPNSAYSECIGRYMSKEETTTAFGKKNKKVKSPCDYATYGLFNIGDTVLFDDGKKMTVFPFADVLRDADEIQEQG